MEVHVEDADGLPAVLHLEAAGFRVVERQVGALGEGEAIELASHPEGTLQHAVEGEVGAHDGIVERVFLGAQLLGIVAPIPRLQLGARLVLLQHALVLVALLLGHLQGRYPDVHQALVHVVRRLGQRVVQHVVGVGLEAQDVGTLEAQVDQRVDNLGVVVFAILAAVRVGAPHFLAQLAVGAGLHEGLPRRHLQRHLAAVGQLLAVGVGGLEHVLCKAHGERGNLLVQLAEAGLLVGRYVGAVAHEAFVLLLQQPHLLAVQAEAFALVVDGFDTLEELGVQRYVVAVGREQGGDGLLDGVHLVAGVARGKVEEHGADLLQQPAAVFVGQHGVLEGRRLGVVHYGVDFGLLPLHALLEGGQVVVGLDASKVGNFIRRSPCREKGVVHVGLFFVFAACGQHHRGRCQEYGFFHDCMMFIFVSSSGLCTSSPVSRRRVSWR